MSSGTLVPLPVRGRPCAAAAASTVGATDGATDGGTVTFVTVVGDTSDVVVVVGSVVVVDVLVLVEVDVLVLVDVEVLVELLVVVGASVVVVVTDAPCSQCDTTRLVAVALSLEFDAVADSSTALSLVSTWKCTVPPGVEMTVPAIAPPGLNVALNDHPTSVFVPLRMNSHAC